jgi:hypothetical protein
MGEDPEPLEVRHAVERAVVEARQFVELIDEIDRRAHRRVGHDPALEVSDCLDEVEVGSAA